MKSTVITAGSGVVGFPQFGSVDMALRLAGASVAIHFVSGSLLTRWANCWDAEALPGSRAAASRGVP
ncbi:MAG: hypothetical protein KA169_19540 [Burkholderiaceae bacterium]|nr:hypothetical protein [Burkholderiaceae bacterium]